jgi:hypothetical protein
MDIAQRRQAMRQNNTALRRQAMRQIAGSTAAR